MSYLQKQMNLLKFDKRLLEINFKNGSISQDEYRKYLEGLEDDGNRAEKLDIKPDSDSVKSQQESEDTVSDSTDPVKTEEETDSSGYTFGSGY